MFDRARTCTAHAKQASSEAKAECEKHVAHLTSLSDGVWTESTTIASMFDSTLSHNVTTSCSVTLAIGPHACTCSEAKQRKRRKSKEVIAQP